MHWEATPAENGGNLSWVPDGVGIVGREFAWYPGPQSPCHYFPAAVLGKPEDQSSEQLFWDPHLLFSLPGRVSLLFLSLHC